MESPSSVFAVEEAEQLMRDESLGRMEMNRLLRWLHELDTLGVRGDLRLKTTLMGEVKQMGGRMLNCNVEESSVFNSFISKDCCGDSVN